MPGRGHGNGDGAVVVAEYLTLIVSTITSFRQGSRSAEAVRVASPSGMRGQRYLGRRGLGRWWTLRPAVNGLEFFTFRSLVEH